MNKQIKELAEQAGLGHEQWDTTSQFEAFLEKFAELIVRECLEILNVKEYSYQNGDLAEKIKQHFGVEE